MSILVLADTHLPSQRAAFVDELLGSRLEVASAVVHAGDITSPEVLDRLARYAPLHAVAGNNDIGIDLPETLDVMIDGVSIGVIHDSGLASGRSTRLAKRFPENDVVVFGHSHLPWNESTGVAGRVQHHFNPGSPIQRRRAPHHTVGWIDTVDGVVACRHDIIETV